jgi:hypothetical protein
MVYSNKFVMCVLYQGTPQEELANGVVKLPFGAEYSLRFRNKNSRRAVVKIYIDGENVSGGGYIIPANDHIDIKRHHDKDRSFKFVELDSPEAVDAGKNGPNHDKTKGTIEARFYLEKEKPTYYYPQPYKYEEHHHHHHHHPKPEPVYPWPIRPYPIWCSNDQARGLSAGDAGSAEYGAKLSMDAPVGGTTCSTGAGGQNANSGYANGRRSLSRHKMLGATSEGVTKTCSAPPPAATEMNFAASNENTLRDGCTVEGETTGQKFTTTWIDLEDDYTTLKVFLQGFEREAVQHVDEAPKKGRKTNKDNRIDDLESENERLRKELAELENQKLKDEIEKAKKPKKSRKKTPKKDASK